MTLQGPGPVVSGASIQELLSTASGGIAARHSQGFLSSLPSSLQPPLSSFASDISFQVLGLRCLLAS